MWQWLVLTVSQGSCLTLTFFNKFVKYFPLPPNNFVELTHILNTLPFISATKMSFRFRTVSNPTLQPWTSIFNFGVFTSTQVVIFRKHLKLLPPHLTFDNTPKPWVHHRICIGVDVDFKPSSLPLEDATFLLRFSFN